MAFHTIREIIDKGKQIGAYCALPCAHGRMLNLDALGRRLGYEFKVSAASINHRLRCTVCGRRSGTIRVHQNVKSTAMFDTSGKPFKPPA